MSEALCSTVQGIDFKIDSALWSLGKFIFWCIMFRGAVLDGLGNFCWAVALLRLHFQIWFNSIYLASWIVTRPVECLQEGINRMMVLVWTPIAWVGGGGVIDRQHVSLCWSNGEIYDQCSNTFGSPWQDKLDYDGLPQSWELLETLPQRLWLLLVWTDSNYIFFSTTERTESQMCHCFDYSSILLQGIFDFEKTRDYL